MLLDIGLRVFAQSSKCNLFVLGYLRQATDYHSENGSPLLGRFSVALFRL
jgi:hypothetical protein